jgi:hypothetical protein
VNSRILIMVGCFGGARNGIKIDIQRSKMALSRVRISFFHDREARFGTFFWSNRSNRHAITHKKKKNLKKI